MSDPLDELFEPVKRKRDYTVSVNADTYDIVTKLSQETGKSRPKVIEVLIKAGYDLFEKKRKKNGNK